MFLNCACRLDTTTIKTEYKPMFLYKLKKAYDDNRKEAKAIRY